MRITGGRFRGRPLAAPPGRDVRPTADRVRQAVFNRLVHGGGVLGPGDHVRGRIVLDAFCGTGAMGLEALSRGADCVVALERDPAVAAVATANARRLGAAADGVWTLHRADAVDPPDGHVRADLALIDPPYADDLAGPALQALAIRGWLAEDCLCVVEHDARHTPGLPADAAVLDTRRYGRAAVTLARFPGAAG